MKLFILILAMLVSTTCLYAQAQDIPVKPKLVRTGKFIGISKPLRDLPTLTKEEFLKLERRGKKELKNEEWEAPSYPFASTAQPKGPDQIWQRSNGTKSAASPLAPILNFDGQTSPYYPPDCNGAAGPLHYMQTVNTTYSIYNKTGTLLAGPTNMNLLFGSVTGANYNDGDPVVLYDEQANRFVAVEFSISGSNDYMLFAVSTTSDPTGTWYQYSFDVVDMPDYEKIAVWRDGYYMGTNTQPTTGNDIYVFERSQMLSGLTAQMVAFDNPYRPGTGVVTVPPVDNDGPAAPVGSPGTFIAFNDDAIGGGSDQLWLYELAVNWTTPASSSFNRTQQIAVAPFDTQFNNWEDIDQPGTTRNLCAISTVIMNVPQYRNFGTYQSIVCCHTVDVDATNHAGVRWYELRKTPPSTTWTLRQQGTYAPDAHSRWMGAISMNGSGKIGLGYSLSSATEYPGIRYTGQSAAAYASASGVMDVPEVIALSGTNYQSTYNRWGDYASICVDPSDDQTFWFTTEYIGASEARKTKIITFKIGNAPIVATTAATAITASTATLNGTVNPNSISTTYHFEYGATTSYGSVTTDTPAGSGSSVVAVSANITGLALNATCHFRLVAVNTDGTTYGNDMSFVAGGATVVTTAASAIGLATATSGGNVTADGGSAVSARGVCWATSANPVVGGLHTTDGSGLGIFSSSITGLSASTVYHVRAYATTANGTYYGDDLTFTTLCGIYTLPFSESFSGTTLPGCWSNVDNQGSAQIWQFGTITGQSPNPTLTGNYAYLNSDAYGSGNSQNADLITPTLNLSGYSSVTLQFNHYFKSYSGSSGTLSYSINNGSTWNTLQTYTTTSSANPTAFSQVVAAVAGQAQVKFKWNYTGTYGYYWAIDDVAITGVISSPTLSVSPLSQNVAAIAGSTSFAVTSNSSWTVSSNQAWCTVNTSGTGNGTITASYTQNTTGAARTANITVTVTGLTPVVVAVVQAAPTLAVTPSNQNVTVAAGSSSFTVTSNSSWTASSSQGWCSITTSGSGNGTITANYTLNNTAAARVASITVTVSGLSPIVLTLSQDAPTVSILPANQNVTSAPGSTSFTVTSNTDWSASSNQAWCTVTPSGSGNGSINASYSLNALLTSRVATITVLVSGLSSQTVTVTQAGVVPTLSVAPSGQSVSAASGSTSFDVTSNTDWTATSDQTWCTVTSAGSGSGTITADYSQNVVASARVANITVSAVGLSPLTVTVNQAAAAPPDFLYTMANDVQTSDYTYEFDLLLLDNDVSLPFELATIQAGIYVNPAIYNGGTITASLVSGGSNLNTNQQPVSVTFTQSANIIKLASKAPPGAGSGTIISQNPASPNHVCRIKLTNSVAWATAQPNLTFNFVTTPYATKLSQYISGINTACAVSTSNTYSVCNNGLLNPPPALYVSPSNQTVTAVAGSTGYSVSANRGWTASSDQAWCTVTSSGYGSGTISANFTANATSSARVANITVTMTGLAPQVVTLTQNGETNKTLNLTLFLQGLYEGAGLMHPAMDESGPHWGATIADKITVEFHNAANYSSLVYTVSNVNLNTNGTASITFPAAFSGSYYITVLHRNSIETVTAIPVSFASGTINYSFDVASKAYGNNMLLSTDGRWMIFGGDPNQDGLVDATDMLLIDNDATSFVTGYINNDVNGDGLIDAGDMILLDNNASTFVSKVTP
jgi:hypothetical protein